MDFVENPKTIISESVKILDIQRRSYVAGGFNRDVLLNHFMSIEHGLQFLVKILKLSQNKDLKLRIHDLVAIVKHKLHSIPHDYLIFELDHAYGELRYEMQNVVVKPGTNDYDTLFPEKLNWNDFIITRDFLIQTISILVTSSCMVAQIAPMMKELEEFASKLTSLKALFDYAGTIYAFGLGNEDDEKGVVALVTTFLDGATCLIYLCCIGKLNEDMLVSLRRRFSLLIEETEIKEASLVLGINFTDDLEPDVSLSVLEDDIDISLSHLKSHEEYHTSIVNEGVLKDHIMSLKHGIEFLKRLPKIYIDRDFEQSIVLLARSIKQRLESLAYRDEDANGVFADLGEAMKNVMMNPPTDKYNTFFQKKITEKAYLGSNNDFLVEKIKTIMVSSVCKDDEIAPLNKELQDLRKMLSLLKPLDLFIDNNLLFLCDRGNGLSSLLSALQKPNVFLTLLTIHQKATFPIYLSCIGKMDKETGFLVMSNISTTIKETDVREMYIMSLNEALHIRDYLEEELYLLENMMLLLKSNIDSLNDASFMLYEVLVDIHIFLLGFDPNVFLRKRHLLQPLFQSILGHSIPIVCSCYVEHSEVDISAELNFVLDLIKQIKSEVQEIKLHYFPRVDDLGFLEFFSGYLEDLKKKDVILMKEEIDALHFQVNSVLSLAKDANPEDLNGTQWTDIIDMAYQAEYIIDTYLVSSSRDMGIISSLPNIIEQLKNITIDVHGISSKSLSTQDVVVPSEPQVTDNDAIVGYQEEAITITKYLLEGEIKLDVVSIVGMAGVGKTSLALTLFKSPLVAAHFDILAWCTISEEYEIRNLLLSVLDQVNPVDHDTDLPDWDLADHLSISLEKHRYLLVIDDVCDTMFWENLQSCLPDAGRGSRILITTRNKDYAIRIGSQIIGLHGLSEKKSWELFQKKMLEKESLSNDLLKISKGIVENCKGLPLSIVIIAIILSDMERTMERWNEIAESVRSINVVRWNEIAESVSSIHGVNSSRGLGLISALSKIIEQLKKVDLHGLSSKSIPFQDVGVPSKPQVLRTTTQFSDNDAVVGLQEKEGIMKGYLLNGEMELNVISIVGMAGVGKTTLALTLCKTQEVAIHFDILAFCPVSQSYEVRDLLVSILHQVNPEVQVIKLEDEDIADRLCKCLKKRTYLIVLDDIWDTSSCKYLRRYLPDDKVGSRIIITTRNKDSGFQIGSKVTELHGLSEEDSWKLFEKRMLEKESLSEGLLKISKGILEQCKGLPLSVVIIAGILSGKERTEESWNQIAESVSSSILSDTQGKCKAILELSYNHLPNHLRSCFLYMGSFREDQEISVNHLIMRWIAEGFIRDTNSNSAEEVTKKYMIDLISKSLVIPAKERSRGGVKTFRLHDLLRDFCLDKAKEKHFFALLDRRNEFQPLQDPRRLILSRKRFIEHGINFSCHSIRSMICCNRLGAPELDIGIRSRDMVLLQLLDVDELALGQFPNISSWVLLKYLALSLDDEFISDLPFSICKLLNLEILILKSHCKVLRVPDLIWDMVKLRHVNIRPQASFQVDSGRLDNSSVLLQNLRSLFKARVSCGDSKWLTKLPGLQRLSCVFVDDDTKKDADLPVDDDLEEDDVIEDKEFRMLRFNGHLLTSLKVENGTGRVQRFARTCELPNSLKQLTLSKFFLTSNDISKIGGLCELEVFKIYDCKLPSEQEWNVEDEDFPGLKVLKLRNLEMFDWSITDDSFPSLEQLWVEKCDSLNEIPSEFGFITNLSLIDVKECLPSVDYSAREIENQQHEDQNAKFKVRIYPKK